MDTEDTYEERREAFLLKHSENKQFSDLSPTSQGAIIFLLACLLFFTGMVFMYVWMLPGNGGTVPSYRGGAYSYSGLSYGLWRMIIVPIFDFLGNIIERHGFYILMIILLAGDRILNFFVVSYELLGEYRGYMVSFVCGAGFVILISYIAGSGQMPVSSFPCPQGQALGPGGSCIWVNRY